MPTLTEQIEQAVVLAPFVYDGVQALLAERAGFSAVYVSGFGSAARLGLPDIGLMTFTEMLASARTVADAVAVPVISDADTGYGNPINVTRTIREYEKAGIAALHLEDQIWPKRCGYLAGKEVISASDMIQKLKAALDARRGDMLIIARTDALQAQGWNEAEDRARAYHEVGADLIFVDGIGRKETAVYAERLADLPLMLNNGGLLPMTELAPLNFKLIIHPATMLASFAAISTALRTLKETGDLQVEAGSQTFVEVLETLGLSDYNDLAAKYVSSED